MVSVANACVKLSAGNSRGRNVRRVMTPTQPMPPTTPPGPPPGPPSGPPPASPGAPTKKRGPAVPLVAFIVVVVLLVVAAALAIFAFVGKSSEADDKEKAQKELASTKRRSHGRGS